MMSHRPKCLAGLVVLAGLLLSALASAQWPTNVHDYLYVSNNDTLWECYPHTLPYPDNSTLAVFNFYGIAYQIIDQYGQLLFSQPQPVTPGDILQGNGVNMQVIDDDRGGALICWKKNPSQGPGNGAQRIDSLGNLLWGPIGKEILPWSANNVQYAVCIDGQGGFFVAGSTEGILPAPVLIRVNHFDAFGNPTWGDSGVVVCPTSYNKFYPKVTPDGHGGVWVTWEDERPPYNPYGATFMQRLNADGDPELSYNGEFICERAYFTELLPDGYGGLLVHTNAGGSPANTIYRYNPNGNLIWSREQFSWSAHAKMLPGEPGFYYLGYPKDQAIRAQKIDLEGNSYWPFFGSRRGVELINLGGAWAPQTWDDPEPDFAFKSPNFYSLAVFANYSTQRYSRRLIVQATDTSGSVLMGEDGSTIGWIFDENDIYFYHLNICPDNRQGATAVFTFTQGVDDICAKRVNLDGSIGGPVYVPPEVTLSLSPYGAPIQIPATGGSFDFNVSVANAEPGPQSVDIWTSCLQPDSSWLGPLMGPYSVVFPGNWTVSRDRTQEFYYAGSPGIYTYYGYAGNYPFEIWSADSFQFELLPGDNSPHILDLSNRGESFDTLMPGSEVPSTLTQAVSVQISPNPSNSTFQFKYVLPSPARVRMEIFDIAGRLISTLIDRKQNAGDYTVRFEGSALPSGIYLLRLEAGGEVAVGKIAIIK